MLTAHILSIFATFCCVHFTYVRGQASDAPTHNPTSVPTADPTTAAPTVITPAPTDPDQVTCGATPVTVTGDYNDEIIVFDIELPYDGDILIDASASTMFDSTGTDVYSTIGVELEFDDGTLITDGDTADENSGFLVLEVSDADSGSYQLHMFVGPGFPPPTDSTGTFSITFTCATLEPTASPSGAPTMPTMAPTVGGSSSDSDDDDSDSGDGSDSIDLTSDSDDDDDSGDSDDDDSEEDTDSDTSDDDDDTSSEGGSGSGSGSDSSDSEDGTTGFAPSFSCSDLPSSECEEWHRPDGTLLCVLNVLTQDCYGIVPAAGHYGRGTYDEGYKTALYETLQDNRALKALVGVLATLVALLVVAMMGSGYVVYKKTKKMEQVADESMVSTVAQAAASRRLRSDDEPSYMGSHEVYGTE